MTNISNIEHIVKNGITHKNSKFSNPRYVSIGDDSIINRRDNFVMRSGMHLGEYIPFYFGCRMPMLFVIQKGYNGVNVTNPQDIVYCVTSVDEIQKLNLEFIFTNGHAVDSFSKQFDSSEIDKVKEILDYSAIKCTNWKDENDLDKKRRMEAEFLISGDLPSKHILGYICYDDTAKSKLIGFGISEKIIAIRPHYYF